MNDKDQRERLRRWRLILGPEAEAENAAADSDNPDHQIGMLGLEPVDRDQEIDAVLTALYESKASGSLGPSSPNVNRWLGDIRRYFPTSVVRIMQQDALDRLGLHQMLMEPETLESLEPDVQLAATLLSLKQVIPARTRQTARQVVARVVEQLRQRLLEPLAQAVRGAVSRSARNYRPRTHEIDWPLTIRKNLKNYLVEHRTFVIDRLIGHRRRNRSLRDLILCVDQSGSMAESVVYSSVCAAVMAGLPSLNTQMVVFDTEFANMTPHLHDPVELLFGTQLGGGTDIGRALKYCQTLVTRPSDTILVLISDLYEGSDRRALVETAARIKASGVNFITLLALSDGGTPGYDHQVAEIFAALDIPTFACTPDRFPDLMSAAIQRKNIHLWAANHLLEQKG
jgi:Mg-chelatase subunit ChlD